MVADVHAVSGWPASTAFPAETSAGQEDVQTFALEAAERLRLALGALEVAVAAELLAVHQARLLDPARLSGAPAELRDLLDRAADVLPDGPDDRPRGPDLTSLVVLVGREGPTGTAGIPG